MDDLLVTIADYLRYHNARLRPARSAVAEIAWRRAVLRQGGRQVYCRWCGKAITSGEGLFDLEKLREDRVCAEHYIPF